MPSQPTPIELDNLHRRAATPKLVSGLVTDLMDHRHGFHWIRFRSIFCMWPSRTRSR